MTLKRQNAPANVGIRGGFGGAERRKTSNNSPWLADELSHGTVVRPFSSLKTGFDSGPILFWLVLTRFQLTCQNLNVDFYTNDSFYQTFGVDS